MVRNKRYYVKHGQGIPDRQGADAKVLWLTQHKICLVYRAMGSNAEYEKVFDRHTSLSEDKQAFCFCV